MEEKKEAKMADQKLPYEQLENIAHQLHEQNQQLRMQMQEISRDTAFKRLDYLFMVLEHENSFDSNFILTCSDEIKKMMIIQEETTTEEQHEQKT